MIGTASFPEPPPPSLRRSPRVKAGTSILSDATWAQQFSASPLPASGDPSQGRLMNLPALTYLSGMLETNVLNIQKPLEGILCVILDNVLCDTHLSHSSPCDWEASLCCCGCRRFRMYLKSLLSLFFWGGAQTLPCFFQANNTIPCFVYFHI